MLQGLLQSELTDGSIASNIRVLQVLPSFNSGEIEYVVLSTARALVDAKHESFVCSAGGNLVNELEATGSSHISIDLNTRNPIQIFLNGFILAEIISEYKIDIIHVHTPAPAWSLFFARRLIEVPIISTFHRDFSIRNLCGKICKSVLLKFDAAIAASSFIKKHVAKIYGNKAGNKITILETGIDLEQYDPEKLTQHRIKAAKEFLGGIHSYKKKTIVVSAICTKDSNVDYLLDTLENITDNNFQFIILTDSRCDEDDQLSIKTKLLQHRQADNIILKEYYADMPALYHLVDMLISITHKPGLIDVSTIKARAMGCLVAVRKDIAEANGIQNNETGFILPKNNAKQSAEIIMQICAMDNKRQEKIKQQAQAQVKTHYNNAIQTKKLIDLYLKLI
jgi:UDP-N-acetylglucosamine:LPS N-acetylglucosamine transferase